jgi:hypothetical protein
MGKSPQAGPGLPSALALGQHQHGGAKQQREGAAPDEHSYQTDVQLSEPRRLLTAASISVVAAVQVLWVTLLVYGAYCGATWLVP